MRLAYAYTLSVVITKTLCQAIPTIPSVFQKAAVLSKLDDKDALDRLEVVISDTTADSSSEFTSIPVRYFNHSQNGQSVSQIDESDVPEEVLNRFDAAAGSKFEWNDAPAFLQRALLWDSGFIVSHDAGLARVYTECGLTMDDIQTPLRTYASACSDKSNLQQCGRFIRQLNCEGPKLEKVVSCATDSETRTHFHTSMWAQGGSNNQIPHPVMLYQAFADWSLFGIHFHQDPNWGECPADVEKTEPIIPCRPYADIKVKSAWCRPQPTTFMNTWLREWIENTTPPTSPPEQEPPNENPNTGEGPEPETKSTTWIFVLITVVVIIILAIALLYYRRKKQQHSRLSIPDESYIIDEYHTREGEYGQAWKTPVGGDNRSSMKTSSTENSTSFGSSVNRSSHGSSLEDLNLGLTDFVQPNQIEILKSLGTGSFGEVLLGRFSGAFVAIKRTHSWQTESEKESFIHEIELLKSLHHPNIIQFIGVTYYHDQGICVLLEFMQRGDLRSILQEQHLHLTWPVEKHQIARDVAAGLVYLHGFKPPLMHRDLKSRNILIGSSFNAKLADFGLSRHVQAATMTTAGSSLWLAPEICRGERYTEKADVFSFGIIMTELDTHELPYHEVKNEDGEPLIPLAVTHRVAHYGLRPRVSPKCPQSIQQIISMCTRENAADRPTAAEVLAALSELENFDPPIQDQGYVL